MAYKTLRKRQTPESQVTATHARHLPSTSDTSATPPIPSAQTSEPRDSVSSEGTPTISLTPDTFDQDDNGSTVDPRSSNVIKRKALAKNKVAKIMAIIENKDVTPFVELFGNDKCRTCQNAGPECRCFIPTTTGDTPSDEVADSDDENEATTRPARKISKITGCLTCGAHCSLSGVLIRGSGAFRENVSGLKELAQGLNHDSRIAGILVKSLANFVEYEESLSAYEQTLVPVKDEETESVRSSSVA